MIQVSENKINNNKEKFLTVKDVRSIKSLQKFKPNFQTLKKVIGNIGTYILDQHILLVKIFDSEKN